MSPNGNKDLKTETNTTTAVVEYPLQDDDLTHPGLYRYKINTMPHYPYHSRPTRNTSKKLKADEDCDWDLYPTVMREIENHGTPEQVEKLHRILQRS